MFNKREHDDKKLFDEIAINYVKKDLISYCRVARKQRLVRSLKGIKQPINKILEVGCGAGFSVDYLKGKFINYVGVDYSQNLIDYALEHNYQNGVQFECLNINDFETKLKFDVILMIGVLHHMHDPKKIIKLFDKILAPDGIIVVNEPQAGNKLIGLLRKIRKKIDNNYSSDQVEFTENEIRVIFEKCGYEVKTYSQGILSTPLAESRILPGIIGMPIVWVASILDPFLEKLLSILGLKKLTWNVVVHAKPKE